MAEKTNLLNSIHEPHSISVEFCGFSYLSARAEDKQQEPILLPIRAAANRVGIPYKILLEAVNAGYVPYHQIGRSRKLLKIDDVLEAMMFHNKKED